MALKRVYDLIVLDDDNTEYQSIAPVSKMMNLVVRAHVEGPESEAYARHQASREDFLWLGPDGMRMCGTNGSQLWDIAFITQALAETGLAEREENKASMLKALEWLDQCQIQHNPKHMETAYRHESKGAWPFSTRTQGFTLSDCTGEALKAVMYIQEDIPCVLF